MRVKSSRRFRHKKVLNLTKGYRMTKNRLYRLAKDASLHAGQYAFAGRHRRRRDLRSLWIVRINAGIREFGTNYNTFISSLKKNHITLDRKSLSELATNHPAAFKAVAEAAGFTKASA